MLGAYLRDRVVPIARVGHRLIYRFVRHIAGNVHGRNESGQLALSVLSFTNPPSVETLRPDGSGHWCFRPRNAVRDAAGCRRLHGLDGVVLLRITGPAD